MKATQDGTGRLDLTSRPVYNSHYFDSGLMGKHDPRKFSNSQEISEMLVLAGDRTYLVLESIKYSKIFHSVKFSFEAMRSYSPLAIRNLQAAGLLNAMDLMSMMICLQGKETVPKKKKKSHRSDKPDRAAIPSNTEKMVIPDPSTVIKASTELAESSKPTQVTPASSPGKVASDNAPSKNTGGNSFDIRYSPSGEPLLKIGEKRGETVNSPKWAKLNTPALVVDIEDNSISSKQTETASSKKRKRAEMVEDRIIRKVKGLKSRNKDISKRTGAGSLQHKPREWKLTTV